MGLAAIYLRLSRNEEQLDIDEILSNHRNALTKLAKQQKLTYDIYQEISSGVNTDRPQLNLLLSRLDDYDALLVMDIDRISRDNAHAEEIKKMLILHDIKILTPQGAIDFSQESNEMLFSFQAMMANFEYKQIRKRLGRGRLAAAEQGKWTMSNRVPLGYKKNAEKKLEIVEDEAKIIRFIFQKTLERVSANEIARQLDTFGWRSRNGKVLTSAHISQIRRNVVYYGVVQACRRVNGRVVDEVFVENAHEPIINKQTFLEVQEILAENTTGNLFRKSKTKRKLQNLIYCNCCGRKRYIQSDGAGKEFIKSCSYKIDNNVCEDRGHKYQPIEDAVIRAVKEEVAGWESELHTIETTDTSLAEKKLEEQRESLNRNLNRLTSRRKNLVVMRSDGEITKQEFEELRTEAEKQIKQIQQQIDLIDTQLENLANKDQEVERLKTILWKVNNIDTMPAEEVNAFLKTIIRRIRFSSNQHSDHDTTRERPEPTIEIDPL